MILCRPKRQGNTLEQEPFQPLYGRNVLLLPTRLLVQFMSPHTIEPGLEDALTLLQVLFVLPR